LGGPPTIVRAIFDRKAKGFMSNETIFSEVAEDLRRDRMRQLWRTFGPWVIGAAVLVVVGVAGYEGWSWWSKSQSAQWSDKFYAAMQTAQYDPANADKALADLISQTGGGYPLLGKFRQAALLSEQGKPDDAIAAYDVIASTETNAHIRELALLLAANLLIDKGDVDAVQQRVTGLLLAESPLRNAAREVMGLVQYKAGKLDEAMASFQSIIDDPVASRDLRGRAQLYQAQMISEGAKAPVDTPAEPTAATPAVDASAELDVTPPAASAAGSAEASPAIGY
jgi:hypothetical protein